MIHDKTAYFAKHELPFETNEHTTKKISVSIHACNMKSLKLIISFIIEGAIVIFAQCSSNIRHDTVFWC